jgi:hypothetical protein
VARGRDVRARQVYVYTEGAVTEPEYIDIVVGRKLWADPDRTVQHHIANPSAEGKQRKPLRMVQEAAATLRRVEREAGNSGLVKGRHWNWPEVWVLFDRDDHLGIPEAFKLAKDKGVHVAYSHPCFELWRLLHYTNYTSTFGGNCGSANDRLRNSAGFAATYGRGVRTVTEQQSKHVKEGQVLTSPPPSGRGAEDAERGKRFHVAKKHAEKINSGHSAISPNNWDPFTDVYSFVEKGLLLSGY